MELYQVESFERSRYTGDLLNLSEAVWPLRVMLFESFDPILSLFQGPKWTQEARGGASCETRTAAKRARGADSAAIRVCFFFFLVAYLLWFFKGKISFIQSGWERNMYWLLYLSFTVTRLVMQPLSSWLHGWFLPVELFAWKYHLNAPGVAPCSGRAGSGPSKAGEAAGGHCASGGMVKICEGQTKDGLTSYQL